MLLRPVVRNCTLYKYDWKFPSIFAPFLPYRRYGICSRFLNQKEFFKKSNRVLSKNKFTCSAAYSHLHEQTGLRHLSFDMREVKGVFSSSSVDLPVTPLNNFKVRLLDRLIVRPFIDPELYWDEFYEGSVTALEEVTRHLATGDLTMLSGLVKQECLTELKKNITLINLVDRHDLAATVKDLWQMGCSDMKLNFEFDSQGGKKSLEVTMIYFCKGPNCPAVHPSFSLFSEDPMRFIEEWYDFMCHLKVYYLIFTKEYSENMSDQWTVNVINIFKCIDFVKKYFPLNKE